MDYCALLLSSHISFYLTAFQKINKNCMLLCSCSMCELRCECCCVCKFSSSKCAWLRVCYQSSGDQCSTHKVAILRMQMSRPTILFFQHPTTITSALHNSYCILIVSCGIFEFIWYEFMLGTRMQGEH